MTLTLSDIATVVRGVSFDKDDVRDDAAPGFLPILRAGNIEGELLLNSDLVWVPEARLSPEQRMRVHDIAICMSSGSQSVVGKTATLTSPWFGSVGAFCAVVRPTPGRVLPEFLSFFLKSEVFRSWTRQSSGANIKNIRKSELEAFPVPLPADAEQRRIVDLLTRAEGIVRLRREAAAKAAELIPALFIHHFGDPATNPMGWPVVALGELIETGPTNGLYKHKSAYGSGTPILRIDAFYDGVVRDLSALKRLQVEADELQRFGLREGDIVINRVNSPEYLGKSALIPTLPEPTVFESNMMRLAVDVGRVLPRYVIALLQTAAARAHFLSKAKHAINQSSINQQDVKSLPVALPPLDVQRTFAANADAMESILRQQTTALAKAQATFDALLAQAFAPT